jgi:hypothetical protein
VGSYHILLDTRLPNDRWLSRASKPGQSLSTPCFCGQDAVTFKKLDVNTYHVENKLKGKVMTINHIVVTADGKSRTTTGTGTNAEGQEIHNVAAYDKQ